MLSREELMKILQAIAQAKEEAGDPLVSATIMRDDEVEYIDYTSDRKDSAN